MLAVDQDRLAQILAAVEAENQANEDRDMYDENGNDLPPTGAYWMALEKWLTTYDPATLPIAERAMRELDRAYAEFCTTGQDTPSLHFWVKRDAAHHACLRKPPERIVRKTPAELNMEKVPLRQIAKEWRWYIGDTDLPDIARVEREIAEPGSELTEQEIQRRYEFDLVQLGFLLENPQEAEPWQPTDNRPPVPAIEQLVRDRANIAQVAHIKSEEYSSDLAQWTKLVSLLAQLMGVDLPQNAQDAINDSGRELSEAEFGKAAVDGALPSVRTMPEHDHHLDLEGLPPVELPDQLNKPATKEQQVIELFQDGNDVVAIARELRINAKKVKAIINNYQDHRPDGWSG